MKQLMSMTNNQTMTSKELVEVINAIRKEEGNNVEILHKNLLERLRSFDQILGQLDCQPSEYTDSQGKPRPMLLLSKRASMLAVSSESPRVNLAIIDRWQELETQRRPLTQLEAFKELVRLEEERIALLETVTQQSGLLVQQKEVIDHKKIVTGEGEDYFPVSVISDNTGISYSGRRLNKMSDELGIASIPMFASKGQNQVKAYHWSVWEAAYPDVILPE